MSKLSRFLQTYGRPFTRGLKNGKGTIEVLYYDGYVTIRSRQPGSRRYSQEIHITRSSWIKILKAAPGPTRLMEGPDFDRYLAERRYYRAEQQHLEELRAAKKERRDAEARENQRRRHQRAKARARRRAASTD